MQLLCLCDLTAKVLFLYLHHLELGLYLLQDCLELGLIGVYLAQDAALLEEILRKRPFSSSDLLQELTAPQLLLLTDQSLEPTDLNAVQTPHSPLTCAIQRCSLKPLSNIA